MSKIETRHTLVTPLVQAEQTGEAQGELPPPAALALVIGKQGPSRPVELRQRRAVVPAADGGEATTGCVIFSPADRGVNTIQDGAL